MMKEAVVVEGKRGEWGVGGCDRFKPSKCKCGCLCEDDKILILPLVRLIPLGLLDCCGLAPVGPGKGGAVRRERGWGWNRDENSFSCRIVLKIGIILALILIIDC